ncbi:DUF2759 domain-containing protein [Salisediminibacterium halotolerans]|uniref:DUF2759 domain-containing protein n=1 Tax=Salisediminibacterium halotolerans TaxID=517425 RepID=A0A1H9SAQ7_9BACI|nr:MULTISPECIES: DUF2759 domain-containing protein [Salisediminibacterium]RLJ78104.1 uncharacterized protein DUF2759 [Actinophytocola xinjiangensis]RPE88558.1 uncharacterized protein DUF2759 [Salisediminibacterium halotolerans]TWG37081.1 uncharacterized protein DUF2759 [Salisediminibacterium halotolerans]SER82092.1 Protein of unknown function [Salisediminibacterium haloalkalitolerans]GEL06936.1 membrane protein [Salisediminibacterium halotolerans]
MALGVIFLLITILAFIGAVREFKKKNFFAVGFAGITVAVFGWFSVRTIVAFIMYGGGGTV